MDALSEERFPLPMTRIERNALELIKAGKEPSTAALEAVVRGRWTKRAKGKTTTTEPGEKALAGEARSWTRNGQRTRRR